MVEMVERGAVSLFQAFLTQLPCKGGHLEDVSPTKLHDPAPFPACLVYFLGNGLFTGCFMDITFAKSCQLPRSL